MFISEAAALSIVREMKEITGHDINIMAPSLPARTRAVWGNATRGPARSCPKSCPG